ncbi:MAG: lysine--tRNA ligase [Candidatus Limnocylindrus sp. ZSMar2m-chloro-G89]|nr:MAG: lysine--tRNA ligase [Candidatus Limnocylindrus sp. ZSMar2m-chloro-G89]
MYWADELAERVSGPQVVNDSKTPSGTVHVGSLRGPVVHDVIARALRARGVPVEFRYGVEDMDAMDAQALLTPDAVEKYMGVPLSRVPAPDGSTAKNYARHFVETLFFPTFARLGIRPEFYWLSEIYPTGKMDSFMRTALDKAQIIRDLYIRVSNVERPAGWLPVQVICEACGRLGTTLADDWDGSTVHYRCLPDYVKWATGCGHEGRIAPFGGAAKMPFNVEWAAKWSLMGITIEGCGKDLSTKGGSRDRSEAVSREVFDREPPINVMYEFLNVGGKKMSTSKGHGAAAHAVAESIPPSALRFLFLRPRPNQAIDFDPSGTDAIPRLMDEYDRISTATAGKPVRGELPTDHDRMHFYSQVADVDAAGAATAAAAWRPAFGQLSLLLQLPGVDAPARAAEEKGSPLSAAEQQELDERIDAAKHWLADYAPDEARIAVRDELPEDVVRALSAEERAWLLALATAADAAKPTGGEAWQSLIFSAAKEGGLQPVRAFASLYAAFLGRTNGPRAGWLLAALDPALVVTRLRAAAAIE